MALIAEIMATWDNYDVSTKVLAASIRHPTCFSMHAIRCSHSDYANKNIQTINESSSY